MLEKHTTREGETLLVAQMDNRHLKNAIRLALRKAESVVARIEGNEEVNPYIQEMYGERLVTPQEAAHSVKTTLYQMYPYLAELWFRNIDSTEIRQRIAGLIGRKGELSTNALPCAPELEE